MWVTAFLVEEADQFTVDVMTCGYDDGHGQVLEGDVQSGPDNKRSWETSKSIEMSV